MPVAGAPPIPPTPLKPFIPAPAPAPVPTIGDAPRNCGSVGADRASGDAPGYVGSERGARAGAAKPAGAGAPALGLENVLLGNVVLDVFCA